MLIHVVLMGNINYRDALQLQEKLLYLRQKKLVLIPDFGGSSDALMNVIEAKPNVNNHNVEAVLRLYPDVRPMAIYKSSIELLRKVKEFENSIFTKSGIMLGLGEEKTETLEVFKELRKVDCDFLTVGQYLAPSAQHHPVIEYVTPAIFESYKNIAYEMGFKYVASAPLARSSYMADSAFEQ